MNAKPDIKPIDPLGGLDDQDATQIAAFAEQQANHSRTTGLENQKELDWFRQGEAAVYGAMAALLTLQGSHQADEKPAKFLSNLAHVIKSHVDGLAVKPLDNDPSSLETWEELTSFFGIYCGLLAKGEPDHSPQFWQLSGMANAFSVMTMRISPERKVKFGPKLPGGPARTHNLRDVVQGHINAIIHARRVATKDQNREAPQWLSRHQQNN